MLADVINVSRFQHSQTGQTPTVPFISLLQTGAKHIILVSAVELQSYICSLQATSKASRNVLSAYVMRYGWLCTSDSFVFLYLQ